MSSQLRIDLCHVHRQNMEESFSLSVSAGVSEGQRERKGFSTYEYRKSGIGSECIRPRSIRRKESSSLLPWLFLFLCLRMNGEDGCRTRSNAKVLSDREVGRGVLMDEGDDRSAKTRRICTCRTVHPENPFLYPPLQLIKQRFSSISPASPRTHSKGVCVLKNLTHGFASIPCSLETEPRSKCLLCEADLRKKLCC